ncbi:MAG: two-component system, cell cycle sensor histidine kinase and response regulator CckA [Blastocatellia bacterium]|jgi:PAS domain S-box-containing protein|nr:two-component system, cell cycle sensor histidine kinase and response regulator CckA [Blastocatellia bacterium]
MAKILIIDDRPINRQFLTTLLGYQHHELREASDGVEGLRVARDQRPDLIISDVLMPTMDGYEFVRHLREDPDIGATPVIFSTAHYLGRESQALAEKCGVTSIIYKPCEPQTVLEIVAAGLSGPPESEPPTPVQPKEFDRAHQQLLTNKLADKTNQLRDAHGKLTALMEFSTDLANERDPVELLDRYCSVAREVIGARWTLVVLLDRTQKTVRHLGIVGLAVEDSPALRAALLETGVFRTLMDEGRTICLSDVTSTTAALKLPARLPRASSLLVAPLSVRGQIDGWICLADKLGFDAFSEQEEQLTEALAAKMAVAYDNACLYSDSLVYAGKLELEISERARAEEQLKLQGAALESAANAIIITDREGKIIWVNPAFTRTSGYSSEEAVGNNPRLLKSGTQKPGLYQEMWETILAGDVWHGPIVNRRKDGSLINADLTITPIRNGSGIVSRFVGIQQDTTEKTRAEEALLASELRYRRLFESGKDGILILDAGSGEILDVNPFLMDMLAYTKEELVGRELWEIGSFKDIVASKEAFDQLQVQGYIRYEDIPLETKGGVVREVEFISNSYIAGSTRVIQCNIRDIAERKRADEARRESETRYRTLFEYAPDGIVISDPEGYYLDANASMCRMLGYTRDELVGLNSSDIVAPDEIRHIGAALRTLNARDDYHREWQFRRKDGSIFSADVIVTTMPDGNFLGMIRDISERKRAEEAIRGKNEELTTMTQQLWQASKLATMGELAASIAHELNNPLATVGLRTENLLLQLAADSDQRRPLEIIAQEVDRMATLVSDLLLFSRRGHRQVSTVNVCEEVVNSVEFVHYHLRNRKIDVAREFVDKLPTIQADRQQLRQLFLNLLTNASDAMPRGGKLTVRVTSEGSAEGTVAIDFTDSGEGITPENMEKIWEAFYTTKPEGKGTGLGLAICRRIVEEHGGTIDIRSEMGQGTTVRIVLPATDSKEDFLPVELVAENDGSPGFSS